MIKPVPVSGVTKISFVFLLVIIAGFIAVHSNKSLRIDTNLKDLSPQLTEDRGLQHAVSRLSTDIENRFTLLISGQDEADVAEVAALVGDKLSLLQGVQADTGNTRASTALVETLTPFRFGFITESHKDSIANLTQEELVDNANAKLYQIAGAARLLPIDRDPFGWFSDYLFEQSSSISPDEIANPYEVIQVQLSRSGLETSVQDMLQTALADMEQHVRDHYPEVDIYRSGVFFFAAEAAAAAKSDIQMISTVSIMAVVVLLLLTFFSLRPLLLPFISVATGIAFAFVVTHWLYGSIHILTIVFGASLIGIIIDYSLHYFYCHSNLAGENTHTGLLNAMKLSLISSLIGYGALGLSELISLQKVAVFSCAGLAAAWVTVLALANRLMGSNVTINPGFLPPIVNALSKVAASIASKPLVVIGVVTCSILALALTGIRGNDSPRVFFNPSGELLEQEKLVARYASKVEPGQYFVIRADDEKTLFERVNLLMQEFSSDTLLTVSDWLLPPSEQLANAKKQEPLFDKGGAIEQFLNNLGLEAGSLQEEFTSARDQTISSLALFQNPELSLPPLALEHEGKFFSFALVRDSSEVKASGPDWKRVPGVDFIDIASMSSLALKDQRQTSAQFLVLAFLLVAVTLYIRYRVWQKLFMLLVPVAAVTSTLLLLSLFGYGITLFHAMALFLVLGLGMDYVIFVSELQQEKQMTLQAVFLSALTSLLSFGLLSLSSIPVVHAFGITVLIGNSINLAGTFIYANLLRPPAPAVG